MPNQSTASASLAEPDPPPGAFVKVSDQTCGEKNFLVSPLDWGSGGEEDRWIEWIEHTVLHRNSSGKRNFQRLRLEAPGLVTQAG